jgi:PhoH-like ATPase
VAKKIFVLDTSVLLHSPETLRSFKDNDIVIPITVLDELDKFKKGSMEVNRNARLIIKEFDRLREEHHNLNCVPLGTGGTLSVTVQFDTDKLSRNLPEGLLSSNDNRILATAIEIKRRDQTKPVILVTKDINMRVKANALGLQAEDYLADKVNLEELYTGQRILKVPAEVVSSFYKDRRVCRDAIPGVERLFANEYIMLENEENPSNTALARYDAELGECVPLIDTKMEVWGIKPLNREQRYAMDMLLNDKIPLVTLLGKAGTGKTLLAIAAGLQKTANEKLYRKLLIFRPLVPMGRDIGYLPGREEEKLAPWMAPIFDNLEFLLAGYGPNTKKGDIEGKLDYLFDTKLVDIKALTFIRGRSLPYQYIVIDEAQNLTPHEAKTVITRAGEGSKIILTGDAYQIDHPYLDSTSNGLTFIIERFKDQSMAGHITLQKGERSPLAELAATILD